MTKPEIAQEGSTLCQSCGLCCIGVVCDVALVSRSTDVLFIQVPEIYDALEPRGNELQIKLPCPVFKGNCTKYTIRPVDCQTFECSLLSQLNIGTRSLEQCLNIVIKGNELLLEFNS
jgi:Fe-S-cluster containining protein